MVKTRFLAIFIFLFGFFAAYFTAAPFLPESMKGLSPEVPFHLGLDLQGGIHLIYRADVSGIQENEISEAMSGLRDVIERRVNFFGVGEPSIQVEKSGNENRLIVELPGIKDIGQAVALIGETPYLEFKTQRPQEETDEILKAQENNERLNEDPYFISTALTGRYLKRANLDFDQTTYQPQISIEFTKEGSDIFAKITKDNIDKPLAIYLDGAPISAPNVREEITGGRAQITGQFTAQEAKELVRNLNSGALPIPIELISQQSVGASLGEEVLRKSIFAGIVGVLAVAVFLLLWYRLVGIVAIFALAIYSSVVLMLFKMIPVTITAAGIAGFILSIGVAVDANILIFERIKEELRNGKNFKSAIPEGFVRAWTSIRDSNISTLITATILYWFGTSIVKGFALTLGVGILVSLFTSFTATRTFLIVADIKGESKIMKFLLGMPKTL
ncbi:protein translocase subunit SecD [Patescibacteria group bacterium]|nr:protein translocase subunit SecD [Patescibacteria group bacterium]MBU2633492.1 protein translocase subunit SecD [Patescibacteria group bacterium]